MFHFFYLVHFTRLLRVWMATILNNTKLIWQTKEIGEPDSLITSLWFNIKANFVVQYNSCLKFSHPNGQDPTVRLWVGTRKYWNQCLTFTASLHAYTASVYRQAEMAFAFKHIECVKRALDLKQIISVSKIEVQISVINGVRKCPHYILLRNLAVPRVNGFGRVKSSSFNTGRPF